MNSKNRYNTQKAIKKKKKIVHNVYGYNDSDDVCQNKGVFSNGKLRKGKVHCSCHMCSSKTRKEKQKSVLIAKINKSRPITFEHYE